MSWLGGLCAPMTPQATDGVRCSYVGRQGCLAKLPIQVRLWGVRGQTMSSGKTKVSHIGHPHHAPEGSPCSYLYLVGWVSGMGIVREWGLTTSGRELSNHRVSLIGFLSGVDVLSATNIPTLPSFASRRFHLVTLNLIHHVQMYDTFCLLPHFPSIYVVIYCIYIEVIFYEYCGLFID